MRTTAILCLVPALLAPLVGAAGTSRTTPVEARQSYYSSYRYEKSQNYADAIKALLVVQKADPQDYTVNLRLGWLYHLAGKYANARLHYQKAVSAAPRSIEAKLGYMLPLLAQNRYEQVETVARQVLKRDPGNYYANLRLAYALRMQKKLELALNVVRAMVEFYPTDVSFLTEFGLIKAALGYRHSARRIFSDVLILDPENVTAKQQLGKL